MDTRWKSAWWPAGPICSETQQLRPEVTCILLTVRERERGECASLLGPLPEPPSHPSLGQHWLGPPQHRGSLSPWPQVQGSIHRPEIPHTRAPGAGPASPQLQRRGWVPPAREIWSRTLSPRCPLRDIPSSSSLLPCNGAGVSSDTAGPRSQPGAHEGGMESWHQDRTGLLAQAGVRGPHSRDRDLAPQGLCLSWVL